jgi:hypothetical protein
MSSSTVTEEKVYWSVSTELGHLRSPRHLVVRLPAVRRLELLL